MLIFSFFASVFSISGFHTKDILNLSKIVTSLKFCATNTAVDEILLS